MYVSLEKGNPGKNVVLADICDVAASLIYRRNRKGPEDEAIELNETEILTLCRRAIDKGMFKKSDL